MGEIMVIYGGRNAESIVWDDVWTLTPAGVNRNSSTRSDSATGSPIHRGWHWENQNTISLDVVLLARAPTATQKPSLLTFFACVVLAPRRRLPRAAMLTRLWLFRPPSCGGPSSLHPALRLGLVDGGMTG